MSETNTVETFIYGALAGDSVLLTALGGLAIDKIFNAQARRNATLPYVVFQQQSGVDLMVVGSVRVWSNFLYVVRATAEADNYSGVLQIAAGRIDAVLHAASGTNVNGTVWACVREKPFVLPEPREGRVFRHLGGIYRIYAKAA
jgi:hypothetical protein